LRSILIELKLELPAKKDIDGLVRAVQVPLRLSPGRNDLPAEIEADLRQVLSGLTSVAKGIGALQDDKALHVLDPSNDLHAQ